MSRDYFAFYSAPSEAKDVVMTENTKNPNGLVRIYTTFQDLGVLNRNGRIYTHENMSAQLKTPRMLELLETGGLKGEFGHPATTDSARQCRVDPTMVCHRILDLKIEGNLINGIAEESGPYGQYFRQDVLAGEKIAFSFRGMGEARPGPNGVTIANITFPVTWDRVYYPSHKVAYQTGLCESADPVKNGNILLSESYNDIQINKEENESLKNFIKEESSRLKRINQAFDESLSIKGYDKKREIVTMESVNGDIVRFKLDDFVIKSII